MKFLRNNPGVTPKVAIGLLLMWIILSPFEPDSIHTTQATYRASADPATVERPDWAFNACLQTDLPTLFKTQDREVSSCGPREIDAMLLWLQDADKLGPRWTDGPELYDRGLEP